MVLKPLDCDFIKKYFHSAWLILINTEVVIEFRGKYMEEIFKGLVERAHYYEQFESFRNTNLTGQLGNVQLMSFKVRALIPV